MDNNNLVEKANYIRKDVVSICVKNEAGHIAPSLSCIEILVALYYSVLAYDAANPYWQDRDRLIISKAHGGYSVYSILADKGIIPKQEWENFYKKGSILSGCMERNVKYGVEAGCGSLGHGLPIATGIAFGAKLQQYKYHTFCLIGDGELQEGTTWEALQFALKHNLDNLTIIVDRNRLQAMDFITNVLDKTEANIIERFKGFGLQPIVHPGHDPVGLSDLLNKLKSLSSGIPNLVIAETVKGYGLKCMENVAKFHFRIPSKEEINTD